MAFNRHVALALQEDFELSQKDVCAALCDELKDMYPGEYCYVCDIFGDDESGDVVYYCDGDTWRAPYEIGMVNGKRTTAIDDDQAIEVIPRTVYDEEADEDDHYAGMSQADAAEARKLTPDARRMLFSERFISKDERDAADSSDFAGKGKSFPILKPGDVMAAVRSMGRAGSDNKSTDSLKSSIIRIAKKKGWTKYLPKAWQDGADSSESQTRVTEPGAIKLTESATTLEAIVLREAKADYSIKLIAPGKGSSAFYPAEVLKRDGPNVFKAGTHVYLNHPTSAEEAARPEGDVKNLAGVLTTTADYQENGSKGPGLYARMKVFADHGQMVEEKAAHVGMSIRASGIAEAGGKMRDGLPILKQLTSAESVDVVTRAGAGGMILTEAARTANSHEEGDMTPEEIKALVKETIGGELKTALKEALGGITAPVTTLTERALREDAQHQAVAILAPVTLPDTSKQRVIETVLRDPIPMKDGKIDSVKLTEAINAQAKIEGQYVAELTGSGRVTSLGGAPVHQMTEADQKAARKAEKRAFKESRNVFEELMGNKQAAEYAVKGRAS